MKQDSLKHIKKSRKKKMFKTVQTGGTSRGQHGGCACGIREVVGREEESSCWKEGRWYLLYLNIWAKDSERCCTCHRESA